MRKIRSRILSLMLIFSLFVGMVGIINVDTSYAASKKIHLKKTTVNLVKGKTYQQKLINKKGKTIKATKVKWKSLKTSVAKINKNGKITALKAGTAKMTAKYKGKTYKFTVKVKAVPVSTPASNDYKNGAINPLKTDTDMALQYAKSMSANYSEWVYLSYANYSSNNNRNEYLNAYLSDLDATIAWLEKARSITGSKVPMAVKTQAAKNAGYTTWDSMISSLLTETISLKDENAERSRFGYSFDKAKAFNDKLDEVKSGIEIASNEFYNYK